jgi:hypothetical protein
VSIAGGEGPLFGATPGLFNRRRACFDQAQNKCGALRWFETGMSVTQVNAYTAFMASFGRLEHSLSGRRQK